MAELGSSPGTWIQEPQEDTTWFSPLLPGSSLGAGASETFPLDHFLTGDLWHHYFHKEVYSRDRNAPATIKRVLRHSRHERSPGLTPPVQLPVLSPCKNLSSWNAWADNLPVCHPLGHRFLRTGQF